MRLAVIGAICVALIVAIVALAGGPRQSVTALRDARALANLPQVELGPMLSADEGTPDLVVFQDGADGWFELDMAALPEGLRIGFYGTRLIDAFTGNAHVPLYCTGTTQRPGKIIWVVQDAQIVADYAFCSPRRMDLGPLRPFAVSVELVREDLTRDEVEDLELALADDPHRAPVVLPQDISDLTHRRIVTLPHLWVAPQSRGRLYDVEQALQDAIETHLGEAEVSFTRRPQSNPNLVLTPEDGGPQVNGMAIQVGARSGVVPGIWAEPMVIRVACRPEACARLDSLDFTPLIAPARDIEALHAAMAEIVLRAADDPGPTPGLYPTIEALEDDRLEISDPQPVTYQTRYIVRQGGD
ncbi:hypothetical protein [Hasllibacter sp. MH4015]|uniref:hypothetical protein n=1 Tax=Hasllibacter sp. MH4015 TaxID=2854029 RepID=UPI001CD670FE|nr:hypothetical protein [Hasllibacter sp. MH4015]